MFILRNLFLLMILLAVNSVPVQAVKVKKAGKAVESMLRTEKDPVQLKARVLDTTGNTLGIEQSDTCIAIELNKDNSTKTYIISISGKIFTHAEKITGSATGTPGHLMYKNYIGAYYHKKPGKNMPGAARRTIYCDGSCIARE